MPVRFAMPDGTHPAEVDDARLKIALMVRRFVPAAGGLESWAHDLAKALLARGCRVRVLTTAADASIPGLEVTQVPSADDPMRQARLFEATAERLSGEIVHDTGVGLGCDLFQPQMGCQTLNLARHVAIQPALGRLRFMVSPKARRYARSVREREAAQLRSARAVIAVSNETASVFRDRFGVDADRIIAIPNGIDTQRFHPAHARQGRAPLRRSMNISDDTLVLLAAANNFRLKGLQLTIEALAALRRRDMLLLVAGDGETREFKALASAAGVADKVRFLGRIDDMPSLYGAADLFVHPSAHDACSLATLEAMASGLPVITTRFNGAADGMAHGREGLLLANLSASAMVDALTELSDPDRRAAIGLHARRLAERHDFHDTVDKLMAVYQMLHRHPRFQQ
jgi:UDP-glucose:(heptosyl)LPS alpha-1,3-glucosyltransferase